MPRTDMKPKRRLCVVSLIETLFHFGGAESMARTIATHLDRSRFRSVLYATRRSVAIRPEVVSALDGIEAYELDRRSSLDLAAWQPLIAFLRRERVDVLHSHMFGSNVWGTLVARLAGVPVVIAHEHTWSYEGQPIRKLLDRELVSRAADVFLAVSQEDRQSMIDVEGIDPACIRVTPIAPWSFVHSQSSVERRDVRGELGIAPDDPVVGTVCVLRPQKALRVLVRAAATLAHEFPRLQVLIAGIGPEEDSLRALIDELGLGHVVRLLGQWESSDVPRLLGAFDVAVNCSDYEGTSAAIVEMMAAARPVVATRVGGTPGLIDDGVHGLLVEPQDPDALATAIRRLLDDAKLRARLGDAARERQRRQFDLPALVGRLEDLYESLWAATMRGRRERLLL